MSIRSFNECVNWSFGVLSFQILGCIIRLGTGLSFFCFFPLFQEISWIDKWPLFCLMIFYVSQPLEVLHKRKILILKHHKALNMELYLFYQTFVKLNFNSFCFIIILDFFIFLFLVIGMAEQCSWFKSSPSISQLLNLLDFLNSELETLRTQILSETKFYTCDTEIPFK